MKRGPISSSLGAHIEIQGQPYQMPMPDIHDIPNKVRGAKKRFIRELPGAGSDENSEGPLISRFRRFVRKFLFKHVVPLSKAEWNSSLSCPKTRFERWIATTSYSGPRRRELIDLAEMNNYVLPRKFRGSKVKSHIKFETYPEFKEARWINSRPDTWKVNFGCLIKRVEEDIYKLPFFFKHLKESEKVDILCKRIDIPGCKFFESDYTAYESSFVPWLMEATSGQLYRYFYRNVPAAKKMIRQYMGVVCGDQSCMVRGVKVKCLARRMSGELDTSLANGFANLMLMLFIAEESGCSIKGLVIEGDDCLAAYTGNEPDIKIYSRLGVTIKFQQHERFSDASFCGLRFDPVDKKVIPDIRKTVKKFGWSNNKSVFVGDEYRRLLLRAKAFSLDHCYSGVPIVGALARYALRCTGRDGPGSVLKSMMKTRLLDTYELQRLSEVSAPTEFEAVGHRTRLMVEQHQGLTIATQIKLENWLDDQHVLGPLTHPAFGRLLNSFDRIYSLNHCRVLTGDETFKTVYDWFGSSKIG